MTIQSTWYSITTYCYDLLSIANCITLHNIKTSPFEMTLIRSRHISLNKIIPTIVSNNKR